MVASGRQNTLGAEFSRTWTCVRMAGWPGRTGAAEQAAITRLLLRSVQFRAAACRSDVAPVDADATVAGVSVK